MAGKGTPRVGENGAAVSLRWPGTSRKFTAKTDGKRAEIVIFDDIGDSFFGEGITGKSVQAELKAFGDVEEITVRINSPGGAVFDGLAIYNLLAQHPARIIVEIDGLAASAASVIAMAGDEIRMAENALMMIHAASGVTAGNADDMRETADLLEKITDNIINIYTARTGLAREAVAELVADETWLTADEALQLFLITDITPDKAVAATAVAHLRGFRQTDGGKAWSALIGAKFDEMTDTGTVAESLRDLKSTIADAAAIVADAENTPAHTNCSHGRDAESNRRCDVLHGNTNTPVHTERKQHNTNQGTQMEWFKAIGFETEAEAFAAFTELKTYQNGVVSALGASSSVDAVQRLTNLTSQVATLEAAVTASKVKAEAAVVEAQIESLTKELKLAPAMHDWFRGLDAKGRDGFVANASPAVKAPAAPQELSTGDIVLSKEQEAMIAQCELNRDDFIAQLKIDQKAGA